MNRRILVFAVVFTFGLALFGLNIKPSLADVGLLETASTCSSVRVNPYTASGGSITVTVLDASSNTIASTTFTAQAYSDNDITLTFTPLSGEKVTVKAHNNTDNSDAEDLSITLPICASSAFAGPGIPSNFVLRTITCATSVFNAPGGTPVANAHIIGGQTWYVNPIPVKDQSGKSWTEIFVSGPINGWVWTSCVH
jgi:hypothetical protein